MRKARYVIFICLLLPMVISFSARIKDITNLAGVRDNQLIGYGLVVGLDGTGDRVNQAPFTQQSFRNMLMQFGIRLPDGINMLLKNVAAVAVSAKLPPFARNGQKIDVTVSSIGNATGLRGGELILTPLIGADGKVYAMAQGSVVVSGFGAQGGDGSKVIVNVVSSGRIANGATVERTVPMDFIQNGAIIFELTRPDFTTAERIEKTINRAFGNRVAHALDASAVSVRVEDILYSSGYKNGFKCETGNTSIEEDLHRERLYTKYVPIIARIENLNVNPATVRAKVIVNSRTGTIVVGEDVSISPVAVSHGNLAVVISEREFVSQPQGFSQGKTVKGTASDININQQQNRAFVFAPGPSLRDLVAAINAAGAAPGDLIAILEAINSAGALHADLEVI